MKAATAVATHPYPSRTRTLSPPAYRPVLECASLWETRFAASPFILHSHPRAAAISARRVFIARERRRHHRPLGLSAGRRYYSVRQGGRVRPNAAACRAAHRRFKSGPWLSHDTLKPKTIFPWHIFAFESRISGIRQKFRTHIRRRSTSDVHGCLAVPPYGQNQRVVSPYRVFGPISKIVLLSKRFVFTSVGIRHRRSSRVASARRNCSSLIRGSDIACASSAPANRSNSLSLGSAASTQSTYPSSADCKALA